MPDSAQQLFKRHFSHLPARTASAPGQLELLGCQGEQLDGLALSAAVGRYVHIAAAPRTDGRIELVSDTAPARDSFWLSDLKSNPAAPWADGVKGMLAQLQRRGVHFSGFSAAVASEIPPGSCLGLEAALAAATALIVRQLYPFTLTETGISQPPQRNAKGELPALGPAEKWALAKLCPAAAAAGSVAQTGLFGPVSALFGRAWHLMNIDFRSLTVEHAPLIGQVLVLCEPEIPATAPNEPGFGTPHSCGSDLCESLLSCYASAASKLGVPTLRSLDLKSLKANASRLTPREYACAAHVIGEVRRIVAAEQALRDGDHRQFGEYLFQSHQSARDLLKNTSAEVDLLVELARALPGCLGARLAGTGPSPATLNLVAYHQAEGFMNQIARQCAERTSGKLRTLLCQVVAGAV
jgi:galactokinase